MKNSPYRFLVPLQACLLALCLAACGDSSEGSPVRPAPEDTKAEASATELGQSLEDPVTQTLGPEGGSLESNDGRLRVEVPKGALSSETTLSIEAIENHAHGKVGGAFRLKPEGTTFSKPVRLQFHYSEEDVLGTAPELLRVASQTSEGFWALHEDITLDRDAQTVSVDVEHFSDWSLVTGVQLSPQSATVSPGQSVGLEVVVCERVEIEDLLVSLLAKCRSSEFFRALVKDWSVNGVQGGSAEAGTLQVQEDKTAVYTAPAKAPAQNPVAVSAVYPSLQGEEVLLIANVRVQGGLCEGTDPLNPCKFELAAFNGQALPYKDLPREDWQNPEEVTAGSLVLEDFDGDGAGTWSLLQVWLEKRTADDLEHFSQAAGNFTTDASGTLQFTILGHAQTFRGTVMDNTIVLTDYPFTTSNATVDAQLTLQR